MTVSDSQIARRELTIAGSTVAVAGMLSTVGVAGIWWWLAPLATLGTALLTAASDRCREGLWLLYAAAGLATIAILWAVVAGNTGVELIPPALAGVGAGFGANRLLFGVVYSVPDARRRRETAYTVGCNCFKTFATPERRIS